MPLLFSVNLDRFVFHRLNFFDKSASHLGNTTDSLAAGNKSDLLAGGSNTRVTSLVKFDLHRGSVNENMSQEGGSKPETQEHNFSIWKRSNTERNTIATTPHDINVSGNADAALSSSLHTTQFTGSAHAMPLHGGMHTRLTTVALMKLSNRRGKNETLLLAPQFNLLRPPKQVPWEDLQLGQIDSGDCAVHTSLKGQRQYFCLPLIVTIGLTKAATGEVQRWLVHHPNLTAGFFNFYHLRGVGEVQYFNNLRRRKICNDCWSSAPGGPKLELLTRYLKSMDRAAPKFKMRGPDDVGVIWQTEKTPGYWRRADPMDLKTVMPSVRLVLMLRKPSDLVYSRFWYCHTYLYMNKPELGKKKCGGGSFDQFVKSMLTYTKKEDAYIYNYGYNHTGNTLEIFPDSLFIRHLKRWLSVFDRDQLLISFVEDFLDNPFNFLRATQVHAGLPQFNYRQIAHRTKEGIWVASVNSKSKKMGSRYAPMSQEAEDALDAYFLDEVAELRHYLSPRVFIPLHWLNISNKNLHRYGSLISASRADLRLRRKHTGKTYLNMG